MSRRELDPENDRCRVCGEPIGRDRAFFRDDPLPGERWQDVDRFVHCSCLLGKAPPGPKGLEQ